MQKNKKKKSLLGSLNADLLCYMARKNRKEPKGHRGGSNNGYYLSTFWQWHIETILDEMCLSVFLVVSPAFVLLLDKEPVLEISSDAGTTPVGRSNEVLLRCMRLFLNVNKGIHDQWVASVTVCGSALVSFFSPYKAPKYSQTRTLTQIHLVLYPIIPIHAPFQLFNHSRGL